MPVVSQAQRRWAYATQAGKTDAPPSVGREFVEASHGITGLPNRVKHQSGARKNLYFPFHTPSKKKQAGARWFGSMAPMEFPEINSSVPTSAQNPNTGILNTSSGGIRG
jgi:hypothetical protein